MDDDTTCELFEEFYRRISLLGEPKSRALWNAKLALRKQGYPARDWAAWVLTGASD